MALERDRERWAIQRNFRADQLCSALYDIGNHRAGPDGVYRVAFESGVAKPDDDRMLGEDAVLESAEEVDEEAAEWFSSAELWTTAG